MPTSRVKPLASGRRPRKKLRTPNPQVYDRILAAANQLINEQGFPALRIDEVAEQAGVSVGTFYLYFDGKDDLFTSLVVQHTAQIRARRQQAQQGDGSVIERLGRGLDAYLDFVEENEQGFQYFRRAGSVATTAGDLSSWAFSQHADDYRHLVREAIEQRLLKPIDVELFIQVMLAATQHVAGYWLEHRDEYRREDIERFLAEMSLAVLKGLAPDDTE